MNQFYYGTNGAKKSAVPSQFSNQKINSQPATLHMDDTSFFRVRMMGGLIAMVLTGIFLLLQVQFHAQVSTKYTYTPNATSATYTAVSAGTTICSGANVSGTTSNAFYQGAGANVAGSGIPIGFTFKFNCVDYTTVGVHTNAFIWFGTGTPAAATTLTIGNASANLGGTGTIDGLIACWAGSVASTPRIPIGATSYIRYTTTGSAPNRIFKIEWGGYKITGTSNGTGLIPSSQIWLYETSNNVEMYFNNQSSIFISGTRSGQIGLRGTSNADFKILNGGTTGWANIPAGTLNSNVVSTSGSPAFYPNANRVFAFNFTGSCCVPPTIAASALTPGSVTTSSVNLSWTNGNGASRVVVARQTSAVNTAPSTGTDYTAGANAVFASGTNLGSNNYVVYAGTGNSVTVTGLTGGQTYHFAVYDATGTFCYQTTAATASQLIPLCMPPTTAASALSFTNVSTTTMDVNWVRGDGDAGVIVVGRLTATAAVAPLAGTAYTTTTFGSGSGSQLTGAGNYVLYVGSGTTVGVTNLLPSTGYTFSVYEYNAAGTCYGSAVSAAQTTASCAPSTNATAAVFSNVLNTSLTLSFTRGSGTDVLVVARATATANVAPVYNTSYAANPAFGSGATTGTGNFVVYNGTGNSVNITGLTQTTAYTFIVYEYNASPNCYSIAPLSAAITTLNPTQGGTTSTIPCSYTYSATTGFSTITATAGRVLVASGTIDDANYPAQNINSLTNGSGFVFSYSGVDYTSFGINTNGFIWFGSGTPATNTYVPIGSASANLGGSGTIDGVISACGTDLINHGHISAAPNPTQINVVVTGTAPNRIVTIEWSGFVAKAVSTAGYSCWSFLSSSDESRLDFQIKLYEKGGSVGNRIDLCYKDQTPWCVNDLYSFQAGLRGASNTDYLNRSKAAGGTFTTTSTANGGTAAAVISMGATAYVSAVGGVILRYDNTLAVPAISPSPTASNTCPTTTATLTSSTGTNYQWFMNGSLVPGPGSSSQSLNAAQTGNYTVTFSSGSCYVSSAATAVTITPCAVNITASAGSGGTISPSGIAAVPYGTNQAFTITPACGYQVSDVLVDGVSQGSILSYTFINVTVVHTISATFMAAFELCTNGLDDDCDGITDEGCLPNFTGDTPTTSSIVAYSVNVAYPNCYPINGDLTNGGDSPESTIFTGPDQWYTFVAQSIGATITMNSTTMDNAIALYTKTGTVYNLVDSENIHPAGVGGFERLTIGTLTPGVQYYVSAGAASGTTGGPFTICIQQLMPSGCSYVIPSGGFALCSNFKATYRGSATQGVTYNFTFNGVGGGASGTTSLSGTNGLIPLSSASLALRYGGIYDVAVDAVYSLVNGAGVTEVITVPGSVISANCSGVSIMAQPIIEVKLAQRCPATLLRSNYLIGTPIPGNENACGAISYTYEFTQVVSCTDLNTVSAFPLTVTTTGPTPYLQLGNLPYLPNQGAWSVRIRPDFSYGPGIYGPSQTIKVNNTSASSMLPGDPMVDDLDRSTMVQTNTALYPNPCNGEMINLNLTGILGKQLEVRITDLTGRQISQQVFSCDGSLNTILVFNQRLADGMYTIEFKSNGDAWTEKFLVAH